MKAKPIFLSQADKLKSLCHYYQISPIKILDWSIKTLWEKQVNQEVGLLTLLEVSDLLCEEDVP